MKILIIGAGNMGLAYGQSFIDASVVQKDDLYFMDRLDTKAGMVKTLSDNLLMTEPTDLIRQMNLIILSVKPQDFPKLSDQLSPFIHAEHLILSIMAGIKLEAIRRKTGTEKLVRAMPNLPAQVAQGMTVFTASVEVNRKEILTVQNLLNTTGKTIYVEDEAMLDAATAVSGSGPAFVYYFMNAMMEAGRKMGFSAPEAQLLVRQTFLGSVNLLNQNTLHCKEWIERVSSKGGTTEAAMDYFTEVDLVGKIEAGLEVARKRAVKLSENR